MRSCWLFPKLTNTHTPTHNRALAKRRNGYFVSMSMVSMFILGHFVWVCVFVCLYSLSRPQLNPTPLSTFGHRLQCLRVKWLLLYEAHNNKTDMDILQNAFPIVSAVCRWEMTTTSARNEWDGMKWPSLFVYHLLVTLYVWVCVYVCFDDFPKIYTYFIVCCCCRWSCCFVFRLPIFSFSCTRSNKQTDSFYTHSLTSTLFYSHLANDDADEERRRRLTAKWIELFIVWKFLFFLLLNPLPSHHDHFLLMSRSTLFNFCAPIQIFA